MRNHPRQDLRRRDDALFDQRRDRRGERAPELGRESPGSRLIGYGFLVLFGGGAFIYCVGVGFVIDWPDDMPRWKLALIVGIPLVLGAVLASMAWENARPFILDRGQGVLLDRGRPLLALSDVRAVAVTRDPDDSCYFTIDLVLTSGRTFTLRRDWWPLDEREDAALARAEPIAENIGVELRDSLLAIVHQVQC